MGSPLRVSEAAMTLGMSRAKTYQLLVAGKIRGVKLNGVLHVPASELERLRDERLERDMNFKW